MRIWGGLRGLLFHARFYNFRVSLWFIAQPVNPAITMYIIAIAWLYVVFMMAITEQSAVAGIMTFFCYGVFPLTIVLYLMGTPQRKRNRQLQELKKKSTAAPANSDTGMEENDASKHTLRYGNTASAPALDEQMRTQQQQSEEKAAPEN